MGSSASTRAPLEAMDKEIDMEKMMGKWFVISSCPTPFEKNAYNATELYEWIEDEDGSNAEEQQQQQIESKGDDASASGSGSDNDNDNDNYTVSSAGGSADGGGSFSSSNNSNNNNNNRRRRQAKTKRPPHFKVTFGFNKGSFDGPWKEMYQKGSVYSENCAEWRVRPKLLGVYIPVKLPFLIIDCADDYSWVTVGYPSRKYLWIMSREQQMRPALYAQVQARAVEQGYDADRIQMVPQQPQQSAE